MAEGDGYVYNNFKELLLNGGGIDLDNDTIRVALVTSSYTPNIDTHDFFDDVSSYQLSGTGYTAGGATLASKTVTQDDTDNEGVFDAADVTWTAINAGTAAYAVLYKDTGTESSSPLIGYIDMGSKATNGGDLTIQFNAEGILNLT